LGLLASGFQQADDLLPVQVSLMAGGGDVPVGFPADR
jgi:hypothetical protein